MAQTVCDVQHTAEKHPRGGRRTAPQPTLRGPSCNYAGIRCSLNKKVRMQTNFQEYKLSSNVQMYHIGSRGVEVPPVSCRTLLRGGMGRADDRECGGLVARPEGLCRAGSR